MATAIGANNPTLIDFTKQLDGDGKVTNDIVEMLMQQNEMLLDMTWQEANQITSHRSTIRTGMPAPTWRQYYQGVQPTKSTYVQVDEPMGMMEARSVIDKKLADLNGNSSQFRLNEAVGFIEGMNQDMTSVMVYGNVNTSAQKFNGLAPRFNDLTTAFSKENIIDAGGTSTDNTSIWLVGWSPRTAYGIFPKGCRPACSASTTACRKCSTRAAIATPPTRKSSPGMPACACAIGAPWCASPTSTCQPRRRDQRGRHPQADDQGRAQAPGRARRLLPLGILRQQHRHHDARHPGAEQGERLPHRRRRGRPGKAHVPQDPDPPRRPDHQHGGARRLTVRTARPYRKPEGKFRCCSTALANWTMPTPIRRAAISTNVIDLLPNTAPTGGQTNLIRDIGAGEELHLSILITTTVTTNVSTVFTLESDDNTSLSSATVHWTSPTILLASLVAGYWAAQGIIIPPGAYSAISAFA
jgi:hypothetical protein